MDGGAHQAEPQGMHPSRGNHNPTLRYGVISGLDNVWHAVGLQWITSIPVLLLINEESEAGVLLAQRAASLGDCGGRGGEMGQDVKSWKEPEK